MKIFAYIAPSIGIIALLIALYKNFKINKEDSGNTKMREISYFISQGSIAFLKREYKLLSIFVLCTSILIACAHIQNSILMLQSVSFIAGAICSGLSGFFGMKVATKTNVKTANAARHSLPRAFNIAFSGGAWFIWIWYFVSFF
jgi:K(+)-stimulated pyrophosphate-energized sodium pump